MRGRLDESLPSFGRVLGDRCKVLGLPVWQIDASGAVAVAPCGWGPADEWLQAPALAALVAAAVAARPAAEKRAREIELFPGCWLLPLVGGGGVPVDFGLAAMALGRAVFGARQFAATCTEAGLDASMVRTALSPLARYERPDLGRLFTTLQWMRDDLARLGENDRALGAFSIDLVEAYEHMNLLYRLGASINHLNDPRAFAAMTCELLYDNLEFQWLAVKFGPVSGMEGALDRILLTAGHVSCDRRRFESCAVRLLKHTDASVPTMLLEPGRSEMATLVGSEVMASPVVCGDRVVGVILAGNKRGRDPEVSSIDMSLVKASAQYLGSFCHSALAYHEQRAMFLGTLRAITSTIEANDRYTRGHSERVAHLSAQLARAHGLSDQEVGRVRLAGMLHDVGKVGIPQALLRKAGRLTADEFALIKRHPVIGYNILKGIELLRDVLPGVLCHHERWDGTGYPQGLAGLAIPLFGRVLAVADMFDAMSSERSYRITAPRQNVLQEIERRAGTQLDPELAALFLTLDLSEYDQMIACHVQQSEQAA